MANEKKYRSIKLFGRTISLFWKILDYWYIFLVYAGIMTLISLIFKRWSYACYDESTKFWCNSLSNFTDSTAYIYIIVFYVILSTICFSFGYDIYNTAFKNGVFKIKNTIKINQDKFKFVAFSFGCIISLIIAIALSYMIMIKPANPDWRIEFIYFVIAFSCAMFILLFIRMSSFIGYYMDQLKMPSLKVIYNKTIGFAFTPIFLFLTIMIVCCIIQVNIMRSLISINSDNSFGSAVFSEYIDYFFKLLYYSMLLAFFRAQYELLFDNDELEANNIIISEKDKNMAEDKTATPQRTKKKAPSPERMTKSSARKKTTSQKKK